MRVKVTLKEMKQQQNIVAVGYCDLQMLLKFAYPLMYSSGITGWLCDYYKTPRGWISTGYVPVGKRIDYKRVRYYERKAMEIWVSGKYNEKEKSINRLLNRFYKEFGL